MPSRIFTIPPEVEFAPALARGLWNLAEQNPLKLAEMLVLLPTRRAAKHLRDAFAAITPSALLPRLQPLGDADEDELIFEQGAAAFDVPPAISPLRRQMLLTQLVLKRDATMSHDQASLQAKALAQLLDEAHVNRRDLHNLSTLVKDKDLAAHWQETVQFLSILTEAWPQILRDEGCIDPAERRNLLLAAQAERWKKNPPAYPVIAAGSTGSLPATAELLAAIAAMPKGMVVLPGLDQHIDEAAWQEVADTHPQYALKDLLVRFNIKRENVQMWGNKSASPRTRLLQESMRPAKVSEAWRDLTPEHIPASAVENFTRLDLDHVEEEAAVIALALRAALEVPDKTAALITLDRSLAERVAANLLRWNITVDDSGGAALGAQPAGGFLLTLLSAASPEASTVDTLAFLKHPLAACGLAPAACRVHARDVEVNYWRRRMMPDEETPAPPAFLDTINAAFAALRRDWYKPLPLTERITAHRILAEQLAASDDETGAERLWKNESGEAMAEFLSAWHVAAAGFPALTGDDYAALLGEMLRATPFRPRQNRHPRLAILGPLEARLTRADFTILGGMNEGVWPPEAAVDPWMSRPMKSTFGLPLPERFIGLSAHDFVQLAAGGEVMITRARRRGNAPTVPSRFLSQLEVVLHALGHTLPETDWAHWARMLDEPDTLIQIVPPAPCPPASVRPKKLAVTKIGEWMRNPYAIYARYILDLKKLESLEDDVDASERGTMIHAAFEKFIAAYMHDLPSTALMELLEIGRGIFAAYDAHPKVKAIWWPRFENVASWFVAHERTRRAVGIHPLAVEAKGEIKLGDFTLTGRVDRIDRLPHGAIEIIDYKTGTVASSTSVESGIEPQLPLLGLITREGGFPAIGKATTESLSYWKLGGRDGEEKPVGTEENTLALIEDAEAGLRELLAAFADEATPYLAVPRAHLAPRYDDYAHLARLAEWGRVRGDE